MVHFEIDDQFLIQTIHDISETEVAFLECKSKVHGGPRELLEKSIVICQLLKDTLRNEIDTLHKHGIQVDIIKFCQKYQKLLRDLHYDVIGYMPSISECEFPPEIVQPIKEILGEFVTDYALIFHPCNIKTFELSAQPDIVEQYLKILSPYVPSKYYKKKYKHPEWYISLAFPRSVSRNPLLHTITLSHEVYHLKDYIENISKSISNNINISPTELKDLVDKTETTKIRVSGFETMLLPRTYSEFYSRDVLESAVMQKCTDIIEDWISELVADLLAIRMFGPAFLFASAEHSLALNVMDRDSDDHPNSRMRLKLMIIELRNLGYLKSRKRNTEIIEIIRAWEDYLDKPATTVQEHIHSFTARSISNSRNILTSKIRKITEGKDYSSGRFHSEVWQLVNLINNGITPSELFNIKKKDSKPPSLAGILNAGYMAYYSGLDSLRKILGGSGESGRIYSKQKLDELLLKAIESTNVWRNWPNS